MTYPHSTGFQKGSATSQASAEMLDESGSAASQSDFIQENIRFAGDHGFTVDEMTMLMKSGDFPMIHNGTVAGRFVHLEKQFVIKKTDQTRKSRSGRDVTVYVTHDGTPYEIKRSKREVAFDELEECKNFLDALVRGKQIKDSVFADRAPEIVSKMTGVLGLLR